MHARSSRSCLFAGVAATLLALVPSASPTRAEENPRVVLGSPRVLASPDVPAAFLAELPASLTVERLGWPLPEGPLLILALPGTDPRARALLEALGLLEPGEDLAGGYRRAAWLDGARPLGALVASDGAALMAARFELDVLPTRARGMGGRALDFAAPPEEGELALAAGVRDVRPRYRMRAACVDASPREAVLAARAGYATHVWLAPQADDPDAAGAAAEVERLAEGVASARRHGIAPVLVFPAAAPEHLTSRMLAWQRRLGVPELAVAFPAGLDAPEEMRRIVRLASGGLRAAGTGTRLTVVPPLGAQPLDLDEGLDADVDVASWDGGAPDATRPALLVEAWGRPDARALQRPPRPVLHLPSRPRRGPTPPDAAATGVLVLGDAAAAQRVLEHAWGEGEGGDDWRDVLMPLLPAGSPSPRAFLVEAADRLEAADAASRGALPWMAPLARAVREEAGRLGDESWGVPLVPRGVLLDGVLDEPSWAFAASRPLPAPDGRLARLLAQSDGSTLTLGLRAPAGWRLEVTVRDVRSGRETTLEMHEGRASAQGSPPDPLPSLASRRHGDEVTVEMALDRFALGGDAHPLKTYELVVTRIEGDRLQILLLGDVVVVR